LNGQGDNSLKIKQGIKDLGRGAAATVGIHVDPESRRFNELVSELTIKRPLLAISLLKQVGLDRHDAEHFATMKRELESKCTRIFAGVNVGFFEDEVGHICWDPDRDSTRCCDTMQEAQETANDAFGVVAGGVVDSLEVLAANTRQSRGN
jgi:hypothetical protein